MPFDRCPRNGQLVWIPSQSNGKFEAAVPGRLSVYCCSAAGDDLVCISGTGYAIEKSLLVDRRPIGAVRLIDAAKSSFQEKLSPSGLDPG